MATSSYMIISHICDHNWLTDVDVMWWIWWWCPSTSGIPCDVMWYDMMWWWCEVGPPGMWNLSISRSRSSTGVEKERYVVRNVCKYIAITLARKQIPITSYSHLFLVFPFIANLHEHGGGVDVVGQSLHQFDKCRSLWGEILHWSWESFLSCISSVLHIIFLKSYHL